MNTSIECIDCPSARLRIVDEDDYVGQAVRTRICHGVSHWSAQAFLAVRHSDCFRLEEQVSPSIGEIGSHQIR